MNRRKFLKLSTLIAPFVLLGTLPAKIFARSKSFDADDIATATKDLFSQEAQVSDAIKLKVPEIAENGANVPITVSTNLEGVETIAILAHENPKPLVAYFEIGPNIKPKVSTRMKMGKTSKVAAIVKTNSGVYKTEKEVKVTIGGCGG